MKNPRLTVKITLAFAVIFFLFTSGSLLGSEKKHEAHWTYKGKYGVLGWGDMKPEFATCKNGRRQSPINISNAQKAKLPEIQFKYQASTLNILNNGHTVQVNYNNGSYIVVGGKRYDLLQFHFHAPSEEQIEGVNMDMVAHLVHSNSAGQLAVVAILFKKGKINKALQTIWSHIPTKPTPVQTIGSIRFNVKSLLPDKGNYYTFQGSLTTPPCTEGVRWFVLKDVVSLSHNQHLRFWNIYRFNNRPTQPLNGRRVQISSD